MKKLLFIVCTLIFLLCSSCDMWRSLPPDTGLDAGEGDVLEEQVAKEEDENYVFIEVSGQYILGFECSCFYPCASDEMWWVKSGDNLIERYNATLSMPERGHERVFVRLSGMRSDIGRYGHLGGGNRSFEVTRVHEIRRSSDMDCR